MNDVNENDKKGSDLFLQIEHFDIVKPIDTKYVPPTTTRVYIVTLMVSLSLLAQGNMFGYTSPALPSLKKDPAFSITEDEESWISSFVSIGSCFGIWGGGILTSFIGRKKALHMSMIPLIFGWTIIAFAQNVNMIYAGRLVMGFCCGIINHVLLYISEIATPQVRGILGSLSISMYYLGIVSVNAVGIFFDWRWTAASCIVPVAILDLALILLPESPYWLIQTGRYKEASVSLEWLRGPTANVAKEMEDIGKTVRPDADSQNQQKNFFKRATITPLVMSVVLLILQQTSGIAAVLFYTVDIFERSGSSIDSSISAVTVGLVQLVMVTLTIFVVDRTSRKLLLAVSGVGMTVSLGLFGIYFKIAESVELEVLSQNFGWVPLLCLIVYLMSFSVGYAIVPWILLGELNTTEFKTVSITISCCLNAVAGFLVGKSFPFMLNWLHPYGTYWFFAGACILSSIYVQIFIPETKGKTFQEIQDNFSKNKSK